MMLFELVSGNLLILWRPIVPVAWCVFVALFAVAAAVYSYWRAPAASPWVRGLMLWLRLFVIVIVLAILLGPSREMPTTQGIHEGSLIVMVDASQSMAIDDMNGSSRMDFLKQTWLAPDTIAKIRDATKVTFYSFAERSYPQYVPPRGEFDVPLIDGQNTYLVQSVNEVLQGMPYSQSNQRLLLLSDGIDSEDATPERLISAARARKAMIYTVPVGSEAVVCDTSLVAVPLQESLYPKESGGIRVRYFQTGANSQRTNVRVSVNGKTDLFPVHFSDRGLGELTIPIQQESPGTYRYDLQLEPLAEETELRNNQATVFVPVTPQRIRVLLLEGQPYWDTKFIAESLRKDERLELTQISQIGPAKVEAIVTRRQEEGGVTVPQTADEWTAYDVVILGKEIQRLLTPASAQSLAEFVLAGNGHVIFARGNAANVTTADGLLIADFLQQIEPVQWSNSTSKITKLESTVDGRLAQWLTIETLGVDFGRAIEELRPWITVENTQSVKGAARVILQATDSDGNSVPALVVGPVGDGMAVSVTGDGSWRWSLYPPTSPQLAGFYDMFWSNLLRYVVLGSDFEPGQQIALSLSETAVQVGTELVIDVRLKQEVPNLQTLRLEIADESGRSESLSLVRQPGRAPRYQAKWPASREGVFEVNLQAPGLTPESLQKNFTTYSLNLERLDTVYRPDFMRQLAERTNGRMYRADQSAEFLNELKVDIQQQVLPPRIEYFWGQAWILVLLLVAAGLEWIIRRLSNLI